MIGKMSHRVTIVTPGTMTPDGYGGYVLSGTNTTVEEWAGMEQMSQRETLLYGLQMGMAVYKFWFTYETGKALTQRNSITFGGSTYRVISVENVNNESKYIEVVANKQTN